MGSRFESSPFSITQHRRPQSLPVHALGVPIVEQEQDFSCGPAALLSILQYFKVWDGPEKDLYKPLHVSARHGVLPEDLVHVARQFGLTASMERDMTIERLRELIAAEKLVILELQAWREVERMTLPWRECWDDGHYVVLVAIDDEFAYFMDPSTDDSYTYMPLSELLERWHDINQTRKECKHQLDIHLGVIIDGIILGEKPKPETRHLSRLE